MSYGEFDEDITSWTRFRAMFPDVSTRLAHCVVGHSRLNNPLSLRELATMSPEKFATRYMAGRKTVHEFTLWQKKHGHALRQKLRLHDNLALKRIDIVDEIARRIPLKKRGQNLCGPCPFHIGSPEPALTVSPSRQIFHCFTCGVGGNVVTFLMKYNGQSHRDVIRDLRCA